MILELWMVAVAIAVLLFIRVPVGLAFIGPSLWWALADGTSNGFALKTTFDGLNSFPLLAVPLFILVGVMANRLGIADRLYEFCLAALGRVRGNLAYVNVGSAVGFSWMSGSALADVAGLGKMQIPQMVKAGYPFGFAAGLTASSSLISPVMPPSIPAVIYAATAPCRPEPSRGLRDTGLSWRRASVLHFSGRATTRRAGRFNRSGSPRVLVPAILPWILRRHLSGLSRRPTASARFSMLSWVVYRTLRDRVLVRLPTRLSSPAAPLTCAAALLGLIPPAQCLAERPPSSSRRCPPARVFMIRQHHPAIPRP